MSACLRRQQRQLDSLCSRTCFFYYFSFGQPNSITSQQNQSWWLLDGPDESYMTPGFPTHMQPQRRGEAEKWRGILMGVLWWLIRWGGHIIFHLVTEQQYMWCALFVSIFASCVWLVLFFRFFFSVCLWAGYFQSWEKSQEKNEHKCERYLFAVAGGSLDVSYLQCLLWYHFVRLSWFVGFLGEVSYVLLW